MNHFMFCHRVIWCAAMWALVGVLQGPLTAAAQAPPEGDLERPNSLPDDPTYRPAQVIILFSGVVTKLATRANGSTIQLGDHSWRFVLIDPNGAKLNVGESRIAGYAWTGLQYVRRARIWTFSGHFVRLDGKNWDEGVYKIEFQARYRNSRNGSFGGWQTIDTGKLTIKKNGAGGPGVGVGGQ